MNDNEKGAWILHHSRKIQRYTSGSNAFPAIDLAGKCGQLLSAISQGEQSQINNNKFESFARACNINIRTELPIIESELIKQRVIERKNSNLEILGIVNSSVLKHTTNIFEENSPTKKEIASIFASEKISSIPILEHNLIEEISDALKINKSDTKEYVGEFKSYSLVDAINDNKLPKYYFNGNLFRLEDEKKFTSVINTLSASDLKKVTEFKLVIEKIGAVPLDQAKKILGNDLFKKLQSINFYDVSTVLNSVGEFSYITSPSAFNKFGNSFIEDSLDLAKAFVSSLTYGMNESNTDRGKITMIQALMRKLISGSYVGPATAIGEDYKILEIKGVIELSSHGDGRYSMRLKKKEVGELALSVLLSGQANDLAITLPHASISGFKGPEENREIERKIDNPQMDKQLAEVLESLRSGGK
ncbi:hypothetical protein [Leptospira bandrabouensis]|uniref:hypothetical protein n=1 Tax=Leptospira bandrabouensis TaxID=2484903 RepID=UPI001EE8BFBB|nr:hypothetical protein [Leptospira bandrabouensis]MCG6146592.1 hypothetical protein [Leptospira bandrabouensis]MCG6161967.1 hypothetical protein [Leptospira bandrabouensis]MCG6166177.1 hypothetical protein [Leptospira bandrabouensis]